MKERETKDLIIRPMEDRDVVEASYIEEEAFSMPWKADDFREMIEKTYAHYFVAVVDGKIAGLCGLRDIAGEGEITNVAVKSELRGKGIGRALLEKTLEKCDELDLKDITLEVRVNNEPAILLYEKLGFVKEGIRPGFYEKPKEDALIMWKRSEE